MNKSKEQQKIGKKKQEDEQLAQQRIIVDQYQRKFDEKEFKKEYPSLYRELTADERKIGLKIREEEDSSEYDETELREILGEQAIEDLPKLTLEELERRRMEKDPLSHYDPNIIDFIRRAKKPEEAVEVIQFLLQRGEISDEEAERALHQLETRGLESFGKHKSSGYYFKYASEKRMEQAMKKLKTQKESKKSKKSDSNQAVNSS